VARAPPANIWVMVAREQLGPLAQHYAGQNLTAYRQALTDPG